MTYYKHPPWSLTGMGAEWLDNAYRDALDHIEKQKTEKIEI